MTAPKPPFEVGRGFSMLLFDPAILFLLLETIKVTEEWEDGMRRNHNYFASSTL